MTDARKSIVSESLERGYETTDATAKPLAIVVIGLILGTLICMLVARWILDGYEADKQRNEAKLHPLAEESQEPPAPRLQEHPTKDLADHRAIEARMLEKYEWVDRQGGIVRIPIERAMQLFAEREGGR